MEMLPLPSAKVTTPGGGVVDLTERTDEKTKQDNMLNIPSPPSPARPASPIEFISSFSPSSSSDSPTTSRPTLAEKTTHSANTARRLSSALAPPSPSNLPLSILRLIHAHLDGLVAVGALKESARERCLSAVEGLNDDLGKAEKIRDSQSRLAE